MSQTTLVWEPNIEPQYRKGNKSNKWVVVAF